MPLNPTKQPTNMNSEQKMIYSKLNRLVIKLFDHLTVCKQMTGV